MRKVDTVLFSVAMALLLAGPAGAQTATYNPPSQPKTADPNVLREKAYRDALRKIPDVKGPSDPWSNARTTEGPKTPTKPKTGGAAN